MVYMVPLCTLPVPLRKIHFSHDWRIHEVQVGKSHSVPFEPIEWLENLHMARTDLELRMCVPNFFCMCPGPSFIAKCNCGRAGKSLGNF